MTDIWRGEEGSAATHTCFASDQQSTKWIFYSIYTFLIIFLKLFNYDDFKVELSHSALNIVFSDPFYWSAEEWNKILVAGNHQYRGTDNTNSINSSLKSHSYWVTLYVSFIFEIMIVLKMFVFRHQVYLRLTMIDSNSLRS